MELEDFKLYIKVMKDKMFRLAYSILKSHEEAEEAVQETFIKIWQKRDTLKSDSNIEGFFMIVLKNHCLDKFKTKHYKYGKTSLDGYEDILPHNHILPDKQAEYKNAAELINVILEQLPQRSQLIIQLRDIEGYSNSEVAKMLDIDENNVKVTLSRTRKKIREILIDKYNYNYNENR